MLRNTTQSWGSVSRSFHWGLGVVVIGMLGYGWWMNHMVTGRPDRLFHRGIHADIGYVLLLLMVIRLIWRAMNPTPAPPAGSPVWERVAAKISHWGLYAITMIVALLGWAHSGAHKPDYADWFGLFRVPQFTSENKANADFYENWHIWLAYVLIGLVTLHILAALFHAFVKDDSVASRMIVGE